MKKSRLLKVVILHLVNIYEVNVLDSCLLLLFFFYSEVEFYLLASNKIITDKGIWT